MVKGQNEAMGKRRKRAKDGCRLGRTTYSCTRASKIFCKELK